MRRIDPNASSWFAACVLAACGVTVQPPSAPAGLTAASLTVTSRSFVANGAIPVDYTCDGKDENPALTWSAPPSATRSIAIVVDDPDAASGVFTHWIAFSLPATATSIPEAADVAALGGRLGVNGFGNARWGGPCPPRGEIHRYRFFVYALEAALEQPEGASRAAVDAAMNGHVLAEGLLYGNFSH